jgi:peptidoglycan/xylan/chitin deacetylase (PgdA/CDA1 family)
MQDIGRLNMTRRALLVILSAITFPLDSASPQDIGPRSIALTFDDLPANTLHGPETHGDILLPIAHTLRREGVPAMGFVNEDKLYDNGRLISGRVRVLEQWLDAGLTLGNHGFRHRDLHNTPLDRYLALIDSGGLITSGLLEGRGHRLTYYRHPFLHTGRSVATRDSVTAHLDRHDMRVAPVTIDNQEWIFARAYERALGCSDRTLANRIGDEYVQYMDSITGYYETQSQSLLGRKIPHVLLLHANRLNADRLGDLIDVYRHRGYAFIAIDRALEDPIFKSEDTYDGPAGITWIHRWAITNGARGSVFAGEPPVSDLTQQAYEDPTELDSCRVPS